MVSLSSIQTSNAQIRTTLPSTLTAVFVGATSGIGETTLKQFAMHTLTPRIYFIGRSEAAGARITEECTALNSNGTYTFLASDTSLLKNVDALCREIREREGYINLLFLSTGSFASRATSEGLHLPASLIFYSRNRFILNLLPLLQAAPPGSLKRIVSCFTGTKEGVVNFEDIQGWKVPVSQFVKQRGHAASLVTLSMVKMAGMKEARGVSFVHDFPGPVKTGIAREMTGVVMGAVKIVLGVLGAFVTKWVPVVESGERHLFWGTSAMFPASEGGRDSDGVPLAGNLGVARGIDGVVGSGVYSIDEKGESAGLAVESLLEGMRKDGAVERVWGEMEERFKEILGSADPI